jgi:hypothetical protein
MRLVRGDNEGEVYTRKSRLPDLSKPSRPTYLEPDIYDTVWNNSIAGTTWALWLDKASTPYANYKRLLNIAFPAFDASINYLTTSKDVLGSHPFMGRTKHLD